MIDYLDWNRDDQVDLLLQVYGVRGSWFEAIARGPGNRWRRIMSDRCAAGAAPGDSVAPAAGTRIPLPSARRDTTR